MTCTQSLTLNMLLRKRAGEVPGVQTDNSFLNCRVGDTGKYFFCYICNKMTRWNYIVRVSQPNAAKPKRPVHLTSAWQFKHSISENKSSLGRATQQLKGQKTFTEFQAFDKTISFWTFISEHSTQKRIEMGSSKDFTSFCTDIPMPEDAAPFSSCFLHHFLRVGWTKFSV